MTPRKPEPFSDSWEAQRPSDFDVLREILKAEWSWSMGDEMRQRGLACLRRVERRAANSQPDPNK